MVWDDDVTFYTIEYYKILCTRTGLICSGILSYTFIYIFNKLIDKKYFKLIIPTSFYCNNESLKYIYWKLSHLNKKTVRYRN